jgi:hypothetical protein
METVVVMEQTEFTPPAKSSASSPNYWSELDEMNDEEVTEQHYLPCHYFDYISGVGMGGLIAVMLGVLRLNVPEAVERCRRIVGAMDSRHSALIGNMRAKNTRKLQSSLDENLLEPMVGVGESKHRARANVAYAQTASMRVDQRMCQT